MIWILVLCQGLVIGCAAGFLLSLVVKWGLHRSFDAKMRNKNSMIRFCFFCIGFWFCVFLSAFIYGMDHAFNLQPFQWQYLFTPLIGAVVAVHVKLPG